MNKQIFNIKQHIDIMSYFNNTNNAPYDPYMPQGENIFSDDHELENNEQTQHQPSKAQALKSEIDDTVGIMRDNINKVAERGERLTSIEDKADNLANSAQGFKRGANRVRKQMWLKDLKMKACLVLGIIVLLVVIIVPIVVHFS